MKNSEFLKEYLLYMPVFESELQKAREILKEANEHHVLLYVEEKEDHIWLEEQRYIFKVNCPTTNFAEAYFYLGRKMAPVMSMRERNIKVKYMKQLKNRNR